MRSACALCVSAGATKSSARCACRPILLLLGRRLLLLGLLLLGENVGAVRCQTFLALNPHYELEKANCTAFVGVKLRKDGKTLFPSQVDAKFEYMGHERF